jgi:8-oxo-dGTP diphosphatase
VLLGWLPKSAYGIVHELTRHILRRPVIGICAVPRTPEGKIVLVRRADNGMWCLPGGTLEWGETLTLGLTRELDEEAGITKHTVERVLGAWSDPMRDARFHAVTITVVCDVEPPSKPPKNPLEIREVRLFAPNELPEKLSFGMEDMLRAAERPGTVLE